MKTSLIIVAGGYSTRMGGSVRKPYLAVNSRPLFFYALDVYSMVACIEQIVFVVNPMDMDMVNDEWSDAFRGYGVTDVVVGGKRRQDSVYNGLMKVRCESEVVLVHDCVRPFVSQDTILRVIDAAYAGGAAIAAVPLKDTIKESCSDRKTVIKRTVPREKLWAAQTPQGFRRNTIMEAYGRLQNEDSDVTDDAQAAEMCGYGVELVEDSYSNIKITTREDLRIAEAFCKR